MKSPDAKLIVALGAGGVGKTTTAASVALDLASRGFRTAVVTVDPAHRLAQALGLEKLSNEASRVKAFDGGGHLDALWLDTRSAFEDLVRRYAGTPEVADRILRNRLFQIIQAQLGGVEEYLGIEKILLLGTSGNYDVCVLDTPPSRHAIDFLESPRHLIRFFDEGILKAFVSDEEPSRGLWSKIVRTGRTQALEVFKNFLGKTFLSELGELLSNLKPVHRAFTETAEGIEAWVRSDDARFMAVSLLESYPLDEVRLLGLELEARGLPKPHALVLNKALPTTAPHAPELAAALGAGPADALALRWRIQNDLRQRLNAERLASLTTVELLRYSNDDLGLETLGRMGRKITDVWAPKDPKFFSKS